MPRKCKKCSIAGVELRGIKNKGGIGGLWCEACFHLFEPAKAFLRWESAMNEYDYSNFEREYLSMGGWRKDGYT